jgi:hypothetical protein
MGWEGTLGELVEEAVMSERRIKAVEGRIAIVALPHELSQKERLALVRTCAAFLVRKFRVAVLYAIHPPPTGGSEFNWHAHLLFTSRRVIAGRALGLKTRELDSFKTGGTHIEAFRSWWCNAMNAALRQGGHEGNVEHKSFARLGDRTEPGCHKGERLTAIARCRQRRLRPLPIPEVIPALQPLPGPAIDAPTLKPSGANSLSTGLGPAASNKPDQLTLRPEPGPPGREASPRLSGEAEGPATWTRPELPTPKPPPEHQGPSP